MNDMKIWFEERILKFEMDDQTKPTTLGTGQKIVEEKWTKDGVRLLIMHAHPIPEPPTQAQKDFLAKAEG